MEVATETVVGCQFLVGRGGQDVVASRGRSVLPHGIVLELFVKLFFGVLERFLPTSRDEGNETRLAALFSGVMRRSVLRVSERWGLFRALLDS